MVHLHYTPFQVTLPRQTPPYPGRDPSQTEPPPGRHPSLPRCPLQRYASYWNAFWFVYKFACCFTLVFSQCKQTLIYCTIEIRADQCLDPVFVCKPIDPVLMF